MNKPRQILLLMPASLLLSALYVLSMLAITSISHGQNTLAYEAHYEAAYKGGWIPITVAAKRTLTATDDQHWQLKFEVESTLVDLNETSRMTLNNAQFTPLKYTFETSGLTAKEKRAQVFHWSKRKVWGEHKKRFWDYELLPNTQNSISYQEQLRLDLMQGKDEFSYPVTYKHKLKIYEFKIVGPSVLQTPNGPINTIEIKQVINKYNKLDNRIWFATDHHYLMVKLKQNRVNGKTQIITLKHATVNQHTWYAFTAAPP